VAKKHIIYVPGKNPKPPESEHKTFLWESLLEGVKRNSFEVYQDLSKHADNFHLAGWNSLYYLTNRDSDEQPWLDVLFNQNQATSEDIKEAHAWHRLTDMLLYSLVDHFPFILKFLPGVLRETAEETQRYFRNQKKVAYEVREVLKKQLRPIFANNEKVLLIGHSLGSVIAYDTLWELSQVEKLQGKVDLFLTLGSPLGMNYVQRRLMGNRFKKKKKYPKNIKQWLNVAAIGDITALDRSFADDFREMLDLGVIESIEDCKKDVYTFFRNEEGLNCHRSYGYLVNNHVGKIIADWWKSSAER